MLLCASKSNVIRTRIRAIAKGGGYAWGYELQKLSQGFMGSGFMRTTQQEKINSQKNAYTSAFELAYQHLDVYLYISWMWKQKHRTHNKLKIQN